VGHSRFAQEGRWLEIRTLRLNKVKKKIKEEKILLSYPLRGLLSDRYDCDKYVCNNKNFDCICYSV
jgi:hypothetical protein